MALNAIQYVGGKGTHLGVLLPLVPVSHTYVEPYGGGASLLLNRPRSQVEVYNDLNGAIVNLFRVLRDPEQFADFQRRVELTLFSKEEFRDACALMLSPEGVDPVKRAWATYVIHNQGISGKLHESEGNWSRAKGVQINVDRWIGKVAKLPRIHDRFSKVQVDSQDALTCITYWDSPGTTFYLDPPYVLDTRSDREYYAFEQEDEHHDQLVEVILNVEGCVVLSGYDHPVYEPLVEAGWEVVKYDKTAVMAVSDGEKPKRTETVWRNPACFDHGVQGQLWE